ncbi:hypothetical protein QBC38DRAFT_505830 [Podospora fimiseda]|uniref:Uncharacterized protein n=1 Tax=Podospora fimiseda TaxID=252190 RepID=A0AAN7H5C3_9PEZI|nr:hypothetical protein QBC38DRAFT_505830 [Podospora fimiseda]
MFLHSGASIHGHEFSGPPPVHNLRNPLLRSALISPQKQRAIPNGPKPAAPVLRQRPASDSIPRRAPSPVVRFREPQDTTFPQTPMEPEDQLSDTDLSEAIPSNSDSAGIIRSVSRRRRQKVPRKATIYGLGYPTPSLLDRTKYVRKVLPRLLLQLQKVSEDGRPRPVLEVFPSSRIAGPVIAPRLAKRFPGIFGVKHHLAYDDIVLVRRDDDLVESDSAESESEDALEKRRLLAVYSPLRHSDEAEIVLDDGSVWLATPLPNGSFDFVHTDDQGHMTTVRWARRHKMVTSPTSSTTVEPSTPSSVSPKTRYTFSIINRLTRRHPVLATLTPTSLSVQDTYTSVAPYPPTACIPNSPSQLSSLGFSTDGESDSGVNANPLDLGDSSNRTVHQIDDKTKMLIAVTALWVALRSGWSPNHTPTHHLSHSETAASPSSHNASRQGRNRRNTWGSRTCQSEATIVTTANCESPAPNNLNLPKRNSLPVRCLSLDKEKISALTSPAVVEMSSCASTPASSIAPRRATSTGAAYMQHRLQAWNSTSENASVIPADHQLLSEELARSSQSTAVPPPPPAPGTANITIRIRRNSIHEQSFGCEDSKWKRSSIGMLVSKRDSILGTKRRKKKNRESVAVMEGLGKESKNLALGGDKKGMRSRMVKWIKGLGTR